MGIHESVEIKQNSAQVWSGKFDTSSQVMLYVPLWNMTNFHKVKLSSFLIPYTICRTFKIFIFLTQTLSDVSI